MTFTPICDPFLDSFPSPTFSLPTNTTLYITHQPPPLFLRPTAPVETPITSYHLLTYLLVPLPPLPPPVPLPRTLVPLVPLHSATTPPLALPAYSSESHPPFLNILLPPPRTLLLLWTLWLLTHPGSHLPSSLSLSPPLRLLFTSDPPFSLASHLLYPFSASRSLVAYTPVPRVGFGSPYPPPPVPPPLPPLVPEPLHLLLHCIMSAGISAIYIALRDPR